MPDADPDLSPKPDPPGRAKIAYSEIFCRGLSAATGGALLGGTIVPALGGPVVLGIVEGLLLGLLWVWLMTDWEKVREDSSANVSDPPPKH